MLQQRLQPWQNGHFESKIKNAKKHAKKKTFLQDIAVVLCKKRLEKTANIRKMRAF